MTAARVVTATFGSSLSTREAVLMLTDASSATSLRVGPPFGIVMRRSRPSGPQDAEGPDGAGAVRTSQSPSPLRRCHRCRRHWHELSGNDEKDVNPTAQMTSKDPQIR